MRRLDVLHLEAQFDAAWDSWIDRAQRQVSGAEFRTRSTVNGRETTNAIRMVGEFTLSTLN